MDPNTRLLTMGAAGAGGKSDYWINLTGASGFDSGSSIAVNNSQDIYVAGSTSSSGQTAGSSDSILLKYDKFGSITWQQRLGGAGLESGSGVTIDASGNIYMSGRTDSTGAGGSDVLISKYNPSGNIQWQRTLGSATTDISNFYNQAVADSSGNVYINGYTRVTPGFNGLTIKYDTNGNLQWYRIYGSTGSPEFRGISLDGSGNVYCVGKVDGTGFSSSNIVIVKYNSSGTLQWQRTLGDNVDTILGNGVTVDASGNVIVTAEGFNYATPTSVSALVAKYNSSGTLQWQRALSGANTDKFIGVSTDSSNNIYAVGLTSSAGAGGVDMLIAKYNSSGTLQWQRTFGRSGATDEARSIKAVGVNSLYITGYTSANGGDVLTVSLPNDGSKTGTYGLYVYATCSLTVSTPTLTSATPSISDTTGGLTSSTSSLTTAATTLASTTTPIS